MGRPTRRQFTPAQKLQIVQELARGEKTMAVLAREHGVDHTTIHRWRAQSQAGALEALSGKRGEPDAEVQHPIRELERALGRKTMELEILGEASRRLG